MAEQTKPQPVAEPLALTPENIASAMALLGEVAKGFGVQTGTTSPVEVPQPDPAPSMPGKATAKPIDLGLIEEMAGTLSPALLAVPESRLKSSRLWTLIGTVATLIVQNPLGLNLSPIAQVCIAGLAGIYIASRSVTGGKATGA